MSIVKNMLINTIYSINHHHSYDKCIEVYDRYFNTIIDKDLRIELLAKLLDNTYYGVRYNPDSLMCKHSYEFTQHYIKYYNAKIRKEKIKKLLKENG